MNKPQIKATKASDEFLIKTDHQSRTFVAWPVHVQDDLTSLVFHLPLEFDKPKTRGNKFKLEKEMITGMEHGTNEIEKKECLIP
ncbi:hypothetical protein V6N12_019319 [Hibiscus sabdariffa]|uniref:Uncharacterized protein n=1 Tax=Hibiscus sabdariffa TaxID=183260 RepID=A0ABR1ZW18_9ROSI